MLSKTIFGIILLLMISGLIFVSCMKRKDVNLKGTKPLSLFYDLSAKTIDGEIISMDNYKNKYILVVNVASECGYTPQYESLQKLYKEHKKDLAILAFPSNDFLNQEPGSNQEIKNFCKVNFGVKFDIFEKISVKGNSQNIHPIYKWLSDKSENGWNSKKPTWNFCKYLIDKDGLLVGFWGSAIDPLSPDIKNKIK
ncbi:MAG: hypothetical protein CBD97_02605 [Pelagibacteraceae bacterium TMED237]|nr:glutathione peroxidase [Candidatus Neomarinimicrobiota bacterium]OUW95597.1 MAG: hypothetical protein CBD97_02605 [Pelagibacteraceae bacterium TMED237]|tara:strand:- start:3545 stop:4132 length:588 start_codon:yes stop_codon:yes gene_type:complete